MRAFAYVIAPPFPFARPSPSVRDMSLPHALDDMRALLGERLSTAPAVLAHHAQSESHVTGRAPDAVAFPRTTDEVAALARISAAHGGR